jgi:hypothetical protein
MQNASEIEKLLLLLEVLPKQPQKLAKRWKAGCYLLLVLTIHRRRRR